MSRSWLFCLLVYFPRVSAISVLVSSLGIVVGRRLVYRQIIKSLIELTKEFGVHPVSEGIHLRGLKENVVLSHVCVEECCVETGWERGTRRCGETR